MAKTRLIPVVCASAPAALHRRLTEPALDARRGNGLQIEVRASGVPLPRFREWLCDEPRLVDQGGGDLGAGLLRAAGPPVVLFGTDIPDPLSACLQAPASALEDALMVSDPAEDGGSYMFGLRRLMPSLFRTMPWGTEQGLVTDAEQLSGRGAAPAPLPTLADLDRPEDLASWPELMP